MQNPLPAVITRFREGAIAWAADIRAMYSRIRLSADDQRYHRFLWPEENGTTSTCQMTRLTFGVNCSPYVAIRTTWRAAEDAGPEFRDAEIAIKSSIYVDDYLGSADHLSHAVRIATMVKKVLADGDFHLEGFVSNSPEFTNALQPSERNRDGREEVHDIGADEEEPVLGIMWRPHRDTLPVLRY